MTSLKVAFLWHNHQPNYELEGEFILPWVRFHCIKDYLTLPSLLLKYPNVKQSFNFVPSLIDQIELLADGNVIDKVLNYTYPNPDNMEPEQKQFIKDNFFTCNYDNMISVYEGYNLLYQKRNESINDWTNQELLDLQVWYNLTWCGYDIRKNEFIERLFQKGKNYTQEEKMYLIEIQLEYLRHFLDNLRLINKSNQLEISFSPYYHPILPLLNDFQVVKENLPDTDTDTEFSFPEDSEIQIAGALDRYEEIFGINSSGMWSSEGSLSNEVLDQFIKHKVEWTASDKDLLKNTKGELFAPLEIYFPRKYKKKEGEINIFFRDSHLSDKIGFHYSGMNAESAVNDFFVELSRIKNNLVDTYEEDVLQKACVYVILDGENCWEFYNNNGIGFINKLFETFSKSEEYKTVTMSESSRVASIPFETIKDIKAGSWIYGNFKIWAGESKNHLAWRLLADARKQLSDSKGKVESDLWDDAYYYILRAEASDWFWWYYSGHYAPNKLDFDVLFRENLKKVYKILDVKIPKILNKPLWNEDEIESILKGDGTSDAMHQVD